MLQQTCKDFNITEGGCKYTDCKFKVSHWCKAFIDEHLLMNVCVTACLLKEVVAIQNLLGQPSEAGLYGEDIRGQLEVSRGDGGHHEGEGRGRGGHVGHSGMTCFLYVGGLG